MVSGLMDIYIELIWWKSNHSLYSVSFEKRHSVEVKSTDSRLKPSIFESWLYHFYLYSHEQVTQGL